MVDGGHDDCQRLGEGGAADECRVAGNLFAAAEDVYDLAAGHAADSAATRVVFPQAEVEGVHHSDVHDADVRNGDGDFHSDEEDVHGCYKRRSRWDNHRLRPNLHAAEVPCLLRRLLEQVEGRASGHGTCVGRARVSLQKWVCHRA